MKIYRLSDDVPEQDKDGADIVGLVAIIVAVFLVLHLSK